MKNSLGIFQGEVLRLFLLEYSYIYNKIAYKYPFRQYDFLRMKYHLDTYSE